MYLPHLTGFAAATAPFGPFFNSSTTMVGTAARSVGTVARSAIPGSTSGSSSCPANADILCNGPSQFAICSNGKAIWQDVADGTICQCLGSQCNIIAGDAGKQANLGKHSSASSPAVATSSISSAPAAQSSSPSSAPAGSSAAAPTYPSAAPSSASGPSSSGSPSGSYTYKTFHGNGSPSDGWPAISDWLSFEDLWTANLAIMSTGCAAFSVPNNTPQEIADIKAALLSESQATGVDSRFALALMGQESLFCAHVPTTDNGVSNGGLYQSHDGSGTCYNKATCSKSDIVQMVKDGLAGTSSGPGLQQLIKQAPGSGSQAYFQAARVYNSGSADYANLDDGITSTASYCSDVANRLLGWNSGPSFFTD